MPMHTLFPELVSVVSYGHIMHASDVEYMHTMHMDVSKNTINSTFVQFQAIPQWGLG